MYYEEMSDFEINWKVAEVLGLRSIHERGGSVCYQMQFGGSCMVDYCNNPSDAWPIIDKNKIDMIYEHVNDGEWFAGVTCNEDFTQYEPWTTGPKAFRNAMIVFLMMNEGKS